jgi:hypothetical protein
MGAIVYVISELFHVGRRFGSPLATVLGIVFGFFLAFGTDLILIHVGA